MLSCLDIPKDKYYISIDNTFYVFIFKEKWNYQCFQWFKTVKLFGISVNNHVTTLFMNDF